MNSNYIGVASIVFNLAISIYVYKNANGVTADGQVPVKIEQRVVDGRNPILETYTVIDEVTYGGDQVSSDFSGSIRDKAYVVENGKGEKAMLYSHHIQNLKKKDKIAGWFAQINTTTKQYGDKMYFVTPVEIFETKQEKSL